MSSGVNALAASVVEDYVKKWRPGLSDSQLALISKAISVVSGVVAFGFVFIAESMGNIFSAVCQEFISLFSMKICCIIIFKRLPTNHSVCY